MKKVIIHIDEQEKWSTALGNIRNLKKEERAYDVEVVVNGSAINGYMTVEISQSVESLAQQNVLFVACNNSLQGHHIEKGKLNPVIRVVPSGIVEIIEQQYKGAAYVKP